jgi:hypothetical protein
MYRRMIWISVKVEFKRMRREIVVDHFKVIIRHLLSIMIDTFRAISKPRPAEIRYRNTKLSNMMFDSRATHEFIVEIDII